MNFSSPQRYKTFLNFLTTIFLYNGHTITIKSPNKYYLQLKYIYKLFINLLFSTLF